MIEVYTVKIRVCPLITPTLLIGISKQTKDDIIQFYNIPEKKIDAVLPSCNPAFSQPVTMEEKLRIKQLYKLPDEYFLYLVRY